MKTSPTQRSKARMKDLGYVVEITERWNPFAKVRRDLYSFIDLLCIRADETLAVQTTSGSNVSARIAKILSLDTAREWLKSPSRKIEVHGWRKVGAKGKVKRWECRVECVTGEMFL